MVQRGPHRTRHRVRGRLHEQQFGFHIHLRAGFLMTLLHLAIAADVGARFVWCAGGRFGASESGRSRTSGNAMIAETSRRWDAPRRSALQIVQARRRDPGKPARRSSTARASPRAPHAAHAERAVSAARAAVSRAGLEHQRLSGDQVGDSGQATLVRDVHHVRGELEHFHDEVIGHALPPEASSACPAATSPVHQLLYAVRIQRRMYDEEQRHRRRQRNRLQVAHRIVG